MLNDQERNQFIAEKLNAGIKLSDIQKLLEKEHGIRISYFDLRMIATDLEVNWKKLEPAKKPEAPKPAEAVPEPAATGKTVVSVSKLVRPGAMVSGEATFKSGARAEWWIDQTGRPGMAPLPGSPKPTQEDVQDFIPELQQVLAKSGYGY